MDELLAAAEADGREFTPAEASDFAALEAECRDVDAALDRERRLQEIERSLKPVRDVNEETPAEKAAREGNPQPEAVKPADRPWSSFGEFLTAVKRAATGDGRDPRLRQVADYYAGPTGMNEGSPADGGFLVGKDMEQQLLRRMYDTGVLARRVRRRQIGPGSNGLKINAVAETSRATGSRVGGVRAYWVAEGGDKTASQIKLRQMEMTLKKIAALVYATDELLQDAVAMESIAFDAVAEEFGFLIDDAILQGTGAGMPLGIANAGALVTVSKESGQTAATINTANILNMYSRLWSRSLTNAVWLVGQSALPQLYTLTVGGNNVPLWIPPGGISASPYSTLMGLPVIPVEYASALGTVGDIWLVDLDQYLMIDKGQYPDAIQRASSIHVRFVQDETVFRFVYRCNGAPLWNTALTPYKGSATQSPFVVLETRS
jgi:HK97 family phage major capsid protein